MAFTGKITAIDGRKLLFGERGVKQPDGSVKADSNGRDYEHEFDLKPDAKVLRGQHPDYDECFPTDLKNGQTVKVCGVGLIDGVEVTKAHSVVIVSEPDGKATKSKNRTRSIELAERDECKANKGKASPAPATH